MLKLVSLQIAIFLGFALQAIAQGNLLVTPLRVVFEGNKQKESLNLVNTGSDTATYVISFINYLMNEDGSFTQIENPDSVINSAEPFLRIFPRKVTLNPSEPQVVMLQYTRKADMKPGEYRSHLYFRAEKNDIAVGIGKNVADSSLMSVKMVPVFGLSIPVIIRTGSSQVLANLSNLELVTLNNARQYIKLTLNRQGNISVYGDIIVKFRPKSGRYSEVGVLKGVGVYTNIAKRNIALELTNSGNILRDGTLKVQFINRSENKQEVIAEMELEI